jgi:hypothetical protein
MSNPAQSPWDALLVRVADHIAPLFESPDADPTSARTAALGALATYQPESPADFVNIARILAFSMASLVALGLAAAADLTPAQKMRYFGRANALNRSADQTERLMMQRRRDQRANPPSELPASLNPGDTTPPDDPAINIAVEEAMAAFRATRQSAAAATPAQPPAPQARPAQPGPAPSASAPATSARPPSAFDAAMTTRRPNIPYRQSLLQRSAMPPVISGIPPQPPA